MDFENLIVTRIKERWQAQQAEFGARYELIPGDPLGILGVMMAEKITQAFRYAEKDCSEDRLNCFADLAVLAGLAIVGLEGYRATADLRLPKGSLN